MCISYVFRRSICDIPPNSLNKMFATLRNEIKADDYMNSLKAFFVLRDDYKQFPDDDKFESAFVSRDIYNMRSRNYILGHLENYNNKAPIIIENYTIEHIMPQNARKAGLGVFSIARGFGRLLHRVRRRYDLGEPKHSHRKHRRNRRLFG